VDFKLSIPKNTNVNPVKLPSTPNSDSTKNSMSANQNMRRARGIVWAVALGILTLTFARAVEQTASGFAFDALAGGKSG
jgi:hypothetical protein